MTAQVVCALRLTLQRANGGGLSSFDNLTLICSTVALNLASGSYGVRQSASRDRLTADVQSIKRMCTARCAAFCSWWLQTEAQSLCLAPGLQEGGGVYSGGSSMKLINSTVSDNVASSGTDVFGNGVRKAHIYRPGIAHATAPLPVPLGCPIGTCEGCTHPLRSAWP